MTRIRTPVLIVGGGMGGCAAALALASQGVKCVMSEPHRWLGGQLTSQAVPLDEHPWIEDFGRTELYAELRRRLRARYAVEDRGFDLGRGNPGQAWVSRLAIEPRLAAEVFESWLGSYRKTLTLLRGYRPESAEVRDERILSVQMVHVETGEEVRVEPQFVLEATELGELLPLVGCDYRVGAESKSETGEPHAPEIAEPLSQQAITWVLALTWGEPATDLARPTGYDRWVDFRPPGWPGPLLSWTYPEPRTGARKSLPLFEPEPSWWSYRRVRTASSGRAESSLVNWPQNDQMIQAVVDVPPDDAERGYQLARELSLSWLYWMQTEGGAPQLRPDPEAVGTPDGLAQAAYIRESRRIVPLRRILETDVSAELHPDLRLAESFPDSIGVGAYRIDLHPTPTGDPYLDLSSLPYEIPLRSILPTSLRNLIAAGKCMGSTHITNGCTRLHPVEWNVGESAGRLAAFCLREGSEPHQVAASPTRTTSFQSSLLQAGVEIFWPEDAVHPL